MQSTTDKCRSIQTIIEFDPDGIAGGATVTGYAIYTEAEIQHLALHLNANAVLMDDLDFTGIATGSADSSAPMGALKAAASFSGVTYNGHSIDSFTSGNFVPIGSYIYPVCIPYTGIFCGNGKNITGLIISGTTVDSVGLFGCIKEATIKDLTLSGGTVTGFSYVGGVVGWNEGKLTNVHYSGAVSGGDCYIGGVVGRNFDTVSNCYNSGSVVNGDAVGGVAGGNNGTITDSYNTGAVSSRRTVGGVIGENYGGTLTNSYNTGRLKGRPIISEVWLDLTLE